MSQEFRDVQRILQMSKGQFVERDMKGGSWDVLGILDPPKTERTRLDCLRSLGQLQATLDMTGNPTLQTPLKSSHLRYCRHFVRFECICICLYTIKIPEMRKSPYSVKRTGSTIPAVPELYKIHWMLIYCFCTIVLHLQRIERLGVMLVLSLIMLTFLNIVRQWRGLKTWSFCAQQTLLHITTPNGSLYTGSHNNTDISILQTHSRGHNSVHFRGVPLSTLMYFFVICVGNL